MHAIWTTFQGPTNCPDYVVLRPKLNRFDTDLNCMRDLPQDRARNVNLTAQILDGIGIGIGRQLVQ